MILAVQVPFIPKMNELYQELQTNREQGLRFLNILESTKMIAMLKTPVNALKHIPAPDKLYLDKTNSLYAISDKAEIGTERETFFMKQMSHSHEVVMPEKGDFKVDGKCLFEMSGRKNHSNKSKTKKTIIRPLIHQR